MAWSLRSHQLAPQRSSDARRAIAEVKLLVGHQMGDRKFII
jgi:hypothetical protein